MTEVGEPNPSERLLTVTVDAAALEAAKGRAARRLSREVKVKGFRPGKAPQRLVESVVGAETMRREAIDEALPGAVTAAVREAGLEPAVAPAGDRGARRRRRGRGRRAGHPLARDRPSCPPTAAGTSWWTRRWWGRATSTPTSSACACASPNWRTWTRPGADGDFSLVDVRTRSGESEVAAGSATDLLVEVGAEGFLEGLGEALRGQKAGDIVEFATTLPQGMGEEGGKAVDARVLVKQVKARRLPELTDDWVDEVSEFSTVAEMREALGGELRRLRLGAARLELEERLLDQLREELDLRAARRPHRRRGRCRAAPLRPSPGGPQGHHRAVPGRHRPDRRHAGGRRPHPGRA